MRLSTKRGVSLNETFGVGFPDGIIGDDMAIACFNECGKEIDTSREPYLAVPSSDRKRVNFFCLKCSVLYAQDELSNEDWDDLTK